MEEVYDIAGIGFGPSNLSIAINIEEDYRDKCLKSIFLEQKKTFEWHPGMLLDNAKLQVSFIKDLVTLRNPTSKYTFLNYLKEKNRLSAFANLRNFFPTRMEFNDYLSWAAKKLDRYVRYQTKVISIELIKDKAEEIFKIKAMDLRNNSSEILFAKNIIVGTGGAPKLLPEMNIKPNSIRVWHSSDYLGKIKLVKETLPNIKSFIVIGQGQSAAEIIRDLYNNFPSAKISSIFSKFGFMPADDSEFINELFDPEIVNFLHYASDEARNKIIRDHYNTNYAVVDPALISQIYKMIYLEKINLKPRLKFKNLSRVTCVHELNENVELTCYNLVNKTAEIHTADVVILATGYKVQRLPFLLETMKEHLQLNPVTGKIVVNRNYQICTKEGVRDKIYIQGYNEETHGLSDTLLSLLAIRSNEIVNNLLYNTN